MHSKETNEILSSGTRIMNISDEHPDVLSRLKPELYLKDVVKNSVTRCRNSEIMNVHSVAGTDLCVEMKQSLNTDVNLDLRNGICFFPLSIFLIHSFLILILVLILN